MVLILGNLLVAGLEFLGFRFGSLPPVLLQSRIVRRCRAFGLYMSFNFCPCVLWEVGPRVFVAEHPLDIPLSVEFSPVAVLSPLPGFVRVGLFSVLPRASEHKSVQTCEDFACYLMPVIVSPSFDFRAERSYYL